MTRHNTQSSRRKLLAIVGVMASALVLSHLAPSSTLAAPRTAMPAAAFQSATRVTEQNTDDASLASSERTAKELSLGTRRTASHLLKHSPKREVRNAAEGNGTQKLLWPIEGGNFVRGFGFVRKTRKELPHLGVDIAAKIGTPIHAAADGIVAYANNELKGYGNILFIVHPDGAVTSYAHCSKLLVKPGQTVKAGQVIAKVGSTGVSKGPHLHFEYRQNGRPKNPMAKFDRDWFEAEPTHDHALAMVTR
jgi:murein DD-endopeptidase MepM/ murein hydrolase activator NlpD